MVLEAGLRGQLVCLDFFLAALVPAPPCASEVVMQYMVLME